MQEAEDVPVHSATIMSKLTAAITTAAGAMLNGVKCVIETIRTGFILGNMPGRMIQPIIARVQTFVRFTTKPGFQLRTERGSEGPTGNIGP